MGKVTWNGPACQASILAEVARKIRRGCAIVRDHAKQLLSVDGTAKSAPGRKGRLVYNANPSAPGEAPHLQTGQLRASVADEVEGLKGRVGTNLKKGRWLELGTARMAARPWLRRALAESIAQVKAVFG